MSNRPGGEGGERSPGGPDAPPELLTRLDPERASSGARSEAKTGTRQPQRPRAAVDTRRYRWMIGIFGLVVVIVISLYQFLANGVGTTGVPAGRPLHYFSAPLANTTLVGSPNIDPPCTPARHDPRVLNVCLIAHSRPLVLSFFTTASGQCVRQVDALEQLSRRFAPGAVQFAAVAVNSGRSATAALIRSHHWTIPVAYDSTTTLAGLYGVAVCPMAELAYRGGIVKDRLIGDRWQTSAALAPKVRALVSGGARSR